VTATAANSISIGSKVTMVITSANSPTDMAFSIKLA
jgi:hypothetical protein